MLHSQSLSPYTVLNDHIERAHTAKNNMLGGLTQAKQLIGQSPGRSIKVMIAVPESPLALQDSHTPSEPSTRGPAAAWTPAQKS